MDPQKGSTDESRADSEVEREIDSFEQNKLKDIKVFASPTICLYFVASRLYCFAELI